MDSKKRKKETVGILSAEINNYFFPIFQYNLPKVFGFKGGLAPNFGK